MTGSETGRGKICYWQGDQRSSITSNLFIASERNPTQTTLCTNQNVLTRTAVDICLISKASTSGHLYLLFPLLECFSPDISIVFPLPL